MTEEEYAAYTAKMRREDIVDGAGKYTNGCCSSSVYLAPERLTKRIIHDRLIVSG